MQLVCSLKLLMALLGWSCLPFRPIWLQNGLQNGPKIISKWLQKGSKRGPQKSPKMCPKWTPKWAQNGLKTLLIFGKIKTSLETFVFFMLPWVCVFCCCLGACSVKSRPRSKHSYFPCEKDECFERGLDFTE